MKPYHIQYIILLCFLSYASVGWTQDVDDIIANHIKAHGGCEAWEAVESIEISGRFTAFSEEGDFYAMKTRCGQYYSKVPMGQFDVIEAFDGCKGWTIDPWHDFSFPRELNKNEINVFHLKADFFTPFYKYKERGFTVKLLEEAEVDGLAVYAIELDRNNGIKETWYLDKESYLEYKCITPWVDFSVGVPAESYFDDFRNVDGVVLPFFTERIFWQRDRILQVENIVLNKKLDKKLLEMPRSEAMSKLSFLSGDWDVKVFIRSRRGQWYVHDSTISSIVFEATNLLQEQITYDNGYVQSNTNLYSYDADTETYRLAIYNGFSSKMGIFEGSLNDTSFVLNNSNISFGGDEDKSVFIQIVISDISDDGFVLQRQSSRDKGQSWNTQMKFTYARSNSMEE